MNYIHVPKTLYKCFNCLILFKVILDGSFSPEPPVVEEKTTLSHELSSAFMTPEKDDTTDSSCPSSDVEPELTVEDLTPRPPSADPTTSAMSISPANSEVGSRSISRLSGGSSNTSPPYHHPPSKPAFATPKSRQQTWPRRSQGNRADLDMNWRASATGPASDRSSNSGGERDPPARRNAERADKDGKWREETGGRPPSGAKSKKKNGSLDTSGNYFFINNFFLNKKIIEDFPMRIIKVFSHIYKSLLVLCRKDPFQYTYISLLIYK